MILGALVVAVARLPATKLFRPGTAFALARVLCGGANRRLIGAAVLVGVTRVVAVALGVRPKFRRTLAADAATRGARHSRISATVARAAVAVAMIWVALELRARIPSISDPIVAVGRIAAGRVRRRAVVVV